jgi:excisionase family DNA binding protein
VAAKINLSTVKFMTIAEVAKMLRVSNMTVYRLANDGEMDAIRVGRSFRLPEQAVLAYLSGAGKKTARSRSRSGPLAD